MINDITSLCPAKVLKWPRPCG